MSDWRHPPDFPEHEQEIVCYWMLNGLRKGPAQLMWLSEFNDRLVCWIPAPESFEPLPPCEEA